MTGSRAPVMLLVALARQQELEPALIRHQRVMARIVRVHQWRQTSPAQYRYVFLQFCTRGVFKGPYRSLYFFPRVILYNFLLFWLIYGGLGFGVLGLGSYIGFLGLGFSVDGFGACGVGPSGFLGWGSLYKHKRITLGKKWCLPL